MTNDHYLSSSRVASPPTNAPKIVPVHSPAVLPFQTAPGETQA
ncbi:hypothetical protein [[Phormidium] sp. ETS-05]|nr:hypothetical protein [[Phormidium] sp. ETS-05]